VSASIEPDDKRSAALALDRYESDPSAAAHRQKGMLAVAAGIPAADARGMRGLLVDSVEDRATATLRLLNDRELAAQLGHSGRERVRERFLLTRLLMDELRLLATLEHAEAVSRAG
jgi:glycosyltransferase involved in cell wall biosynthesis